MLRRIILSLMLTTIWTLTSCSSQGNTETQPDSTIQWSDLDITHPAGSQRCWNIPTIGKAPTWEEFKKNFQYGLVMGMSEKDISGASEIGYQTFEVMPNQSLTANLHLWYPEGNTESTTIRFLVLLDERQLTNVFDTGQSYDLLVHSGDDIIITLNLPPLSIGIHDIIIIGIPYVNDYPVPEGIVKILSNRITLIAGTPDASFRPISFSALSAEGLVSKGDPKIPLSLTLTKKSLLTWNWPEKWLSIAPNNSVDFFILAGYENVINADAVYLTELESSFFALLLFVDYQQVDVSPEKNVIYGKVNKNTAYARIPAEVGLLPSGKHHALVLRINLPGIPVCLIQETSEARILPLNITGSLVGIDVTPK